MSDLPRSSRRSPKARCSPQGSEPRNTGGQRLVEGAGLGEGLRGRQGQPRACAAPGPSWEPEDVGSVPAAPRPQAAWPRAAGLTGRSGGCCPTGLPLPSGPPPAHRCWLRRNPSFSARLGLGHLAEEAPSSRTPALGELAPGPSGTVLRRGYLRGRAVQVQAGSASTGT